jgi:hypothetical protein
MPSTLTNRLACYIGEKTGLHNFRVELRFIGAVLASLRVARRGETDQYCTARLQRLQEYEDSLRNDRARLDAKIVRMKTESELVPASFFKRLYATQEEPKRMRRLAGSRLDTLKAQYGVSPATIFQPLAVGDVPNRESRFHLLNLD